MVAMRRAKRFIPSPIRDRDRSRAYPGRIYSETGTSTDDDRYVTANGLGLRGVARLRGHTEVRKALFRELLRLVPPFGEALFLLAQAFSELMLELNKLFQKLGVKSLFFIGELTFGAFALCELPLLDARELRVTLLFEGGDQAAGAP